MVKVHTGGSSALVEVSYERALALAFELMPTLGFTPGEDHAGQRTYLCTDNTTIAAAGAALMMAASMALVAVSDDSFESWIECLRHERDKHDVAPISKQ